ncbi:MAG: glutamate--tRNA ligase family protein, partial [Steroidobacter sp.]
MSVAKSSTETATTATAERLLVPYRGRFAPSPTGPLHFGSLVAAVGSYLCARQAGGEWFLRIEDLDTPRVAPGSADQIISTLDTFGFEWTGSILYQSSRRDAYEAAIHQLLTAGLAYYCSCTRSELQAVSKTNKSDSLLDTDELRYPGWCRNGPREPTRATAVRLFV